MSNYKYETTKKIARAFKRSSISFQDGSNGDEELLLVGVAVDNGPDLVVEYKCTYDSVSINVEKVIVNIQENKYERVKEVCRLLNRNIPFLYFCLDKCDGEVSINCQTILKNGTDNLCEVAIIIYKIISKTLDEEYESFMIALFTGGEIKLRSNLRDEQIDMDELFKMREFSDSEHDDSELLFSEFDSNNKEVEENLNSENINEDNTGNRLDTGLGFLKMLSEEEEVSPEEDGSI